MGPPHRRAGAGGRSAAAVVPQRQHPRRAPRDHPRGARLRQKPRFWREEFYRREDPRGREYFWLTGDFVNAEPQAEDTDEWALAHGYVAVVPVQVDLTDYARAEHLRTLFTE